MAKWYKFQNTKKYEEYFDKLFVKKGLNKSKYEKKENGNVFLALLSDEQLESIIGVLKNLPSSKIIISRIVNDQQIYPNQNESFKLRNILGKHK